MRTEDCHCVTKSGRISQNEIKFGAKLSNVGCKYSFYHGVLFFACCSTKNVFCQDILARFNIFNAEKG